MNNAKVSGETRRMTATMLAQLAMLFDAEAAALLPDPYAYPPDPEASAEARQESTRLTCTGNDVFLRALDSGFGRGPDGSGSDAAFGYLVALYPSR